MNTYSEFKQFADTRRARKLANNTYLVERDDGGLGIRLHSTEVVIYYPDRIVLNSGGWQTVTTKERMNRFSPIRVWSDKGVWYAFNGVTVPYADGITFYNDGRIDGEGDDPNKTIKLRQAVNKYAKDYAAAFSRGEVPAPNGGDCWACLMTAEGGSSPLGGPDHIERHITEKYYVPSILNRMADSGLLSIAAKDYIGRTWSNEHEPPQCFADIAKEQIAKAVRRFCFRELGLAQ